MRWRLPLSYAAVALLTAFVLGAVLLAALNYYYQERERQYLLRNADYISAALAESMAEGTSVDVLQSQVMGWAYLTQMRVQLVNAEWLGIADSGPVDSWALQRFVQERMNDVGRGDGPDLGVAADAPFAPIWPFLTRPPEAVDAPGLPVIPVPAASPVAAASPVPPVLPGAIELEHADGPDEEIRLIPPVESVYTFRPDRTVFIWESDGVSEQFVTQALRHEESGELMGYVVVSGGPSYSQGILSGVAAAWFVSGAVAVLLAALVGAVVSWRMSRPLVGLTGVTAKMAVGDLSVRADARRTDEFGTLALSFNEMADRLQAFILTLQRFVADAAHELNTPLTALRNNLDLALEEEDRGKQALLIKDGRSQVQRLEELAHGLLDLSRLESGERPGEKRPVDLGRLVLKTSEQYASQAEQAGLAFTLEVPAKSDGGLVVQGDEAQLQRALGNLLDNAIKFTPEGGSVHLGLAAADGSIMLWVEDSGIGIPEKDLPLLFNRFHRGRNAAGYPGSGLGLAIVRAITLHHGGEVTAENTVGGARLTIRLPRRA